MNGMLFLSTQTAGKGGWGPRRNEGLASRWGCGQEGWRCAAALEGGFLGRPTCRPWTWGPLRGARGAWKGLQGRGWWELPPWWLEDGAHSVPAERGRGASLQRGGGVRRARGGGRGGPPGGVCVGLSNVGPVSLRVWGRG